MAFEEYSKKIECFIQNIPKRMYRKIGKLDFEVFFTYDKLSLSDAIKCKRQPIEPGTSWGKKWEYGWFFTTIEIPAICHGKKVIFSASQGESVVFVNGKVCGSFDKEHTHITLTNCAVAGEIYDIAMEVYAGHDGLAHTLDQKHAKYIIPGFEVSEFPDNIMQKESKEGSFGIFYDEVFQLWMDINTLYDLCKNLDDNSYRKVKIQKALSRMCDAVNIESLEQDFIFCVNEGLSILKSELECINGSSAPTAYVIGHSHLDLEWLWTRNETQRKIARTIGNQIRLLQEYKDYKYIQSQPWLLSVLKKEYSDLYEEVKKLVKTERFIVDGGTWVEPDTNIPSGESLIRQFIYGKKFIKDEFDIDSQVFWLPDSFGMSASLPQILKGCGIKYFMNAKITWQYNGGDKLPYSYFMWQGNDGSEILTYITQEYATELTPSKILEKWNINNEKADVPMILIPYGHGDGGGGATPIHLEYLRRESDLEGIPKVVSASPMDFFNIVENECSIDNRYVGELYYAAHRGAYTAQAKTKKLNRVCEFSLREAELWSTFSNSDTKKQLDDIWKTVLFNQFHDILPGTSITAVYEKTEEELETAMKKANQITFNACESFVSFQKNCITLFNSLSWNRMVRLELPKDYNSIKGYETQSIGDSYVALVEIPACGFRSFELYNDENNKSEHNLLTNQNDKFVLENELIYVEFNNKGELISLFDKEKNMEYIEFPSNVFKVYQDMPTVFDAWDIDSYYEKLNVDYQAITNIEIEYTGDIESCIVLRKKLLDSEINQKIILNKGSKKIDFITTVDWKETHKLLKVDFNTKIKTDEMMSEVQYGYVKRPNHKSRQYDMDRFEVCQHKWSALCESKRGFSILNDSKYGICADRGRMSLTLLTSSIHPALNADKGMQKFTYSVLPFSDTFADSDVVRNAYELNCPYNIKKGFACAKSFLSVSENNIIVDVVKKAEDGSGDIIIRLYESKNCYTNFDINMNFRVQEVCLTNMLEEKVRTISSDNKVNITIEPFEVITLRIKV